MVLQRVTLAVLAIIMVSGAASAKNQQTWWTRTMNSEGIMTYSTPHFGLSIDGLKKACFPTQDWYNSMFCNSCVGALADDTYHDVVALKHVVAANSSKTAAQAAEMSAIRATLSGLQESVKKLGLPIAGLGLAVANSDARHAALARKVEAYANAQAAINGTGRTAFTALAQQVQGLQSKGALAAAVSAAPAAQPIATSTLRSFTSKQGLIGLAAVATSGVMYGYYNMKQEINRLQEQTKLLQAQEALRAHRINVAAGCGLGVIGIVGSVMLYQQYQAYKASQQSTKTA